MNKKWTMIDRAKLYNQSFPNYPPLVWSGRWVYGIWIIGQNYKSKMKYYGEYPPTFLKRVMSMFPDVEDNRILHLFSGVVKERGIKFDINPNLKPDVCGDAHHLSKYFDKDSFDLIIADPPYSEEDAMHYGTPMINRNKVLNECVKVLSDGGYICWLDQVLPMFKKEVLEMIATIGVVRSTNHRFRVLVIWRKISKVTDVGWF